MFLHKYQCIVNLHANFYSKTLIGSEVTGTYITISTRNVLNIFYVSTSWLLFVADVSYHCLILKLIIILPLLFYALLT